jgi:hypothetical protein
LVVAPANVFFMNAALSGLRGVTFAGNVNGFPNRSPTLNVSRNPSTGAEGLTVIARIINRNILAIRVLREVELEAPQQARADNEKTGFCDMDARADASSGTVSPVVSFFGVAEIGAVDRAQLVVDKPLGVELVGVGVLGLVLVDCIRVGNDGGALRDTVALVDVVSSCGMRDT